MANKTKPTEVSIDDFIKNSDPKKSEDSYQLIAIMEKLSGEKATMWGPSIIGFGSYDYKYESGREGTMCKIGFSPRKSAFSLYVMSPDSEKQKSLVEKLGKIKMGNASCIYFKKLEDLNLDVLKELIKDSLAETQKKYG